MAEAPVIGLLGGGQLGRMLCQAAAPLGYRVLVLDREDCPARQINCDPDHIAGSFTDPDKVRALAARCDLLTVEIEHVDCHVLQEMASRGLASPSARSRIVPVHPSWRTLRLVQDKFEQKEHFQRCNIPVAPQTPLQPGPLLMDSLSETSRLLSFPFLLKARTGSYDGRGNFKINGPQDFGPSLDALGSLPLYAEQWLPFVKELAVVVIRTEDDDGNCTGLYPYPAVETVHEDSICKLVFMPPRALDPALSTTAQKLARDVVATLWGRGVFAVEMFLLADGSLVVNEVAPRPHNSGHYTIEAVPYMSQFKAQLMAVLDTLPPSLTLEPRTPQAIMLNILGGASADSHHNLVHMCRSRSIKDVDIYLHLYGKASKPGRKIGHITFTTPSADVDLESLIAPFVDEVDAIRSRRLSSSTEPQLRPVAAATSALAPAKPISQPPLVVVTMGSDSDLSVLAPGLDVLDKFEVPYMCTITSAHRTPDLMTTLARGAAAKGVKVLIAAAGGAAHLPGMLASETPVPVIGVPVKATHLDGNDSLLSIVQMPRGVPVATVGINNSTNAALLAIRILGSCIPDYQQKMVAYQQQMKVEVEGKATSLEALGYRAYLAKKKDAP